MIFFFKRESFEDFIKAFALKYTIHKIWEDVDITKYNLVVNDQFIATITVTWEELHLFDVDDLHYGYFDENPRFSNCNEFIDLSSNLIKCIQNKVFSFKNVQKYKSYTDIEKNNIVSRCNALLEKGWTLKHESNTTTDLVTVESLMDLFDNSKLKQFKEIHLKYKAIAKERQEKHDKLKKIIRDSSNELDSIYRNNELCKLGAERDTLYEACLKDFPSLHIEITPMNNTSTIKELSMDALLNK